MGRRHYPSDVERTRMVFYIPAARAFWTGRKTPPGPLRKARVFYYGIPAKPPGAVPMRVLRARKMLGAQLGAHMPRSGASSASRWIRRRRPPNSRVLADTSSTTAASSTMATRGVNCKAQVAAPWSASLVDCELLDESFCGSRAAHSDIDGLRLLDEEGRAL